MRILCLCPTYNHARLLCNAIACFAAQTHPDRFLLILDDAGQIAEQSGDRWRIVTVPTRYPSLPAKYNALLEIAQCGPPGPGGSAGWDAVAVWDDDDVYFPWHLSAAAAAFEANPQYQSAKPSIVHSSYRHTMVCRACGATTRDIVDWQPTACALCGSANTYCQPIRERADGRFHGSLVIRREALERIGGWVQTRRADFDQQQLAATAAAGPVGDMLEWSPQQTPSYVYRWQTTGTTHCSGLMRSADNEDWYDRHAAHGPLTPIGQITPAFDAEAAYLIKCVKWTYTGSYSIPWSTTP